MGLAVAFMDHIELSVTIREISRRNAPKPKSRGGSFGLGVGRSKSMKSILRIAFVLAAICALGAAGWSKSKSDPDSTDSKKSAHHEAKKKGGSGKEMGKGGEDIGKGVGKGTGDMAKGTAGAVGSLAHGNVGGAGESIGKGAGGLGKNLAEGTGKGVGKIGKGLGGEIKKLGGKSKENKEKTQS